MRKPPENGAKKKDKKESKKKKRKANQTNVEQNHTESTISVFVFVQNPGSRS